MNNIPLSEVLLCSQIPSGRLSSFWSQYHLQLIHSKAHEPIPGSFWGDSEAGLIKNKLYIRNDTPLHSLFHEACHYICMSNDRRSELDTNAGGDYDEENAVCYLQILLADELTDFSRQRMMWDMDLWGYSFRLGSTEQWFSLDAEDAKEWLISRHIVDKALRVTYQINQQNT